MILAERRSRTRLPENPMTNGFSATRNEIEGELQNGFSSERAREYLHLNSKRLKDHWEQFIGFKVFDCPDFIQEFKSPQKVKIEDGRKIVIPGRIPLFVPDMPVEQLALVCGVDINELIKGAGFTDDQRNGWMLTDASFSSPYLGKTQAEVEKILGNRNGHLVPVDFGIRAYMIFRKYIKRITGEFPDRKTWSILSGSTIGGCQPAIVAKGDNGEGLELRLFPRDINVLNSSMGKRTGLIKG